MGRRPAELDKLRLYDLIYATVWDVARKVELKYPELEGTVLFSGHGKVDFIKTRFADLTEQTINAQQIDDFVLEPALVEWLRPRRFSVVSKELYQLFTGEPYQFTGVCLTQCGADDEVFQLKSPVDFSVSPVD